MRKIILFISVLLLTLSPVEAKIKFGTFMKKGLVNAIKESNENGKRSDAVSELENADSSEELDPDDIRNFYVDMDDNRYQWSQNKSKKSSALMATDGLSLINKQANNAAKLSAAATLSATMCASTVELPVVVETDDFTFGFVTTPVKLKEDVNLMLIFDYQDDRNFKTIVLDDSQYKYIVVDNGVSNTVKTGLVKYPKKPKICTMYIQREGSVVKFFLDGIEYGVFKNVEIDNPTFGVGLLGKAQTMVLKMILKVETNENALEQSTT